MSPDTLKEGAILVADAHCAPWRTPFLYFLKALESGAVKTPQLVLMGDIFDLLFGPIPATHRLNQEALALLNRLSQRIEIVYLEGNHDFLLRELFPNIRVFERREQPWIVEHNGRQIALSHGDRCMGWGYELYTALIRNRILLHLLRWIDNAGKGFIVRFLENAMKRKNHCKPIEAFDQLTLKRLMQCGDPSAGMVIEGHFHQNRALDTSHFHYINLGAFACNERYFTVQSILNQPLLREAVFRKESV